VDLILSNTSTSDVEYDPDTLNGLSDHILVMTKIHTSHFHRIQEQKNTGAKTVKYKWLDGSAVRNYAESANTWQEFTNTVEFTDGLHNIINDTTKDNDDRAAAVE
jgi:hypothetical protein